MNTHSFNLKPFGDQVIIKAEVVEEVTASGIFKPVTTESKPSKGEIVAVGPGTEKALPFQVGTHVMFRQYAATEIEMDGQTYFVLRKEDLIAEITK